MGVSVCTRLRKPESSSSMFGGRPPAVSCSAARERTKASSSSISEMPDGCSPGACSRMACRLREIGVTNRRDRYVDSSSIAARNTSEPAIHTMRLRASSVRSPASGTSTTAASFRPAASVAPIGSCRPR